MRTMPDKITSKNLSYNAALPPFLARLQAQASGDSGPNPQSAAQRRSGKKRSASEDAEDAPLVVDEEGNVVDLQVDKDGTVEQPEDGGGKDESADADVAEAKTTKADTDGKAAIGGRKRKTGKIVGDSLDEKSEKPPQDATDKEPHATISKKTKKKAKKIKLSFDEEDG